MRVESLQDIPSELQRLPFCCLGEIGQQGLEALFACACMLQTDEAWYVGCSMTARLSIEVAPFGSPDDLLCE